MQETTPATVRYFGDHALLTPDKPAFVNASTGAALGYRELDDRSNRLAQYLHAQGLRHGDHVAIFMENNLRFMEVLWAALRSGFYFTPINRYLTAPEAAYIVNDCGARALVSSHAMAIVAAELAPLISECPLRLMVDGVVAGWSSYEDAIAPCPAERLAEESAGAFMLYSSGTTGKPKGIMRPLPKANPAEGWRARDSYVTYGFGPDMIYLSPAPLYHAAPIGFSIATHYYGGTVVMMEKFDPVEALNVIERYRISHSQWVPTMFIRLLKLPEEQRNRFDLSSHRCAIHAAAPCPVDVKKQMIAWWGPILYEYYAGSESNGSTYITSEDWLKHPGSVGRPRIGIVHICDEAGDELPPNKPGTIYFERDDSPFVYHNDPEKTRAAQHPLHPTWTALGDIGYLDPDGYLFLVDRKSFMIISGGVNIYPQAIEDCLVLHPKVADAAVIGVPNADLGEEVKAIIEPSEGVAPSAELAQELIEFTRSRIARYMVPKSVDFIAEMPRLPTGKLYKRGLRDQYWKDAKAVG